MLQLVLTLECRTTRVAQFRVDKTNGQTSRGIFRAAAGVMDFCTSFRVSRVAGVQRSIRTADHVHEMHVSHSSTCDNTYVTPMGALRFRRRYGLKECMPSTINSLI